MASGAPDTANSPARGSQPLAGERPDDWLSPANDNAGPWAKAWRKPTTWAAAVVGAATLVAIAKMANLF